MILQDNFKKLNPRIIFLLDSIGALVSGLMLGIVLVTFNKYIGMPRNILYILAAIAILFSIYSITCYFLNLKNWRPFLKGIAVANILYCLTTAAAVLYFFSELTTIGILYFIGEIIIILTLSINELKYD